MRYEVSAGDNDLHMLLLSYHAEDPSGGRAYKDAKVSSFKEGLALSDPSILTNVKEFEEVVSAQIQPIFPQLVVTQIQNSLAVRQLLPKGPANFELIFYFFGYADDTPEMRMHRIKQANLVGPAGVGSIGDPLATQPGQSGVSGSGHAPPIAHLGRHPPEGQQVTSGL